MPEISVIVPIYNSEKYLERCILSIIEQSYSDIELLLIDDGSTDQSAEICKRFALCDGRIQYYRKENGGAASARNFGLLKAAGEYIAFIDSDDYVGKKYIEKLAEQTQNGYYTIIQCGMTLERGDSRTILSYKETNCNDKEYIRMVLSRQIPIFLFQSTVSKLYKRSAIVGNNLYFDEQISISEDCLFNTMLMPFVSAYCYVDSNAYYYNQNNADSLTHKKKRDFYNIAMCVNVGIVTSSIRNRCILENQLQNDLDVDKGFQKAICIIYLSNAIEIESAQLNRKQRKQLYETYFSEMNYPIDLIIKEYSGTDKILLYASKKKNYRTIHIVHKLRSYKRKILACLRR